MNKKILIVTSKFPWPITGASEADRAHGIEQFIRLGNNIEVITKVSKEKISHPLKKAEEMNISIYPVSYKTVSTRKERFLKYLRIFITQPTLLDGAAYEYSDPEIVTIFKKRLEEFRPDIVWFDMTFMWPLIEYINRKKTRVIVRSQNNEALHFLEEEGMSIQNYFMYGAKFYTEKMAVKGADIIFAISPDEKKFYKSLGAKNVHVLPLRGLPHVLQDKKNISLTPPYHVYFPCSTFNVKHNKKALLFILKEIAPAVLKRHPKEFIFHIFGTKFPNEYEHYLSSAVLYEGNIGNINEDELDIALVPSLSGRGMQQKIFEPIARGMPTITSERGLNGYSFENESDLLLAGTKDEYVESLIKLLDPNFRRRISIKAMHKSKELFSREKLDSKVIII